MTKNISQTVLKNYFEGQNYQEYFLILPNDKRISGIITICLTHSCLETKMFCSKDLINGQIAQIPNNELQKNQDVTQKQQRQSALN
ncbi:hypothetical protein TTHERM_000137609 (macronuclear) [Tetrahymena thermophila SB210]|uniref:Uncharacterized protein n=1 Tax=Tetrahymena thermophila (strain SB210) TaxID=312017 RepID=W7XIP1_TETTS|nr:hypothetical protein TTHERM_000137609 [Tetrahymena thermophila SB210]EWS73484.1 hypothetical protein TTHERM_000137609 [Tetrahymena thermophila SB210]|eukprot:XP_012653966.1 hypothetical protein TTHERM_000137609 [Tetrahymena thermophila SB210]